MRTVRTCLESLGALDKLAGCADRAEEFALIKKIYFRKILAAHPDKGGDAAVFRELQASFEVLRDLFESDAIRSFAQDGNRPTDRAYAAEFAGFGAKATPSWEFYASAAEEAVPTYRVERAKSGRSTCKAKGAASKCGGALIEMGALRVGSLDEDSGSYGRWVNLTCWRVPSKIWQGLPDPATCTDAPAFAAALRSMGAVTLSGVGELDAAGVDAIVRYVMDRANWAKLIKRKKCERLAAHCVAA